MTDPTASSPRPLIGENETVTRTHREIMVIVGGLMITMMLAMLDNTIVAPALPTIVGELGGLEHLAWVTTAYILASTVSTPIFGKLGDLFNRKSVFMAAIVVFLAGSALCGLIGTMEQLIAARALQGIGAGGLMVSIMAIMADVVPPRERGKYTGYLMAVMPAAMIAGPLLGGFITDNFSWHWIFYINLPLGLVALGIIGLTMKLPTRARAQRTFDWVGAVFLTAWITCLVLITSWGGTQHDWNSPVILGLAAATAVAFTVFVFVQGRVVEPIMPLQVFRNLNYTLAVTLSFIVGFALFGGMTFLPQFQQYVQGASATNSGLLLLPMMVTSLVFSLGSGQYVSRTGKYRLFPIVGSAVMALGMYLLSTMTVTTGTVLSGLYMAVLGAGMGFLMQITMTIAQNSVQMRDMGAATGAATFMRNMGGSLGVSLLGALYSHRLQDHIAEKAGGSLPVGGTGLSVEGGADMSPAKIAQLPEPLRNLFKEAVTDAATSVFFWGAVVAAAGIVVALFIKQVTLRGREGSPAAPREPSPEASRA